MNKINVTGNVVQDVEFIQINETLAKLEIRLAGNGRRKTKGEWVDYANYYNITLWGKQAEHWANKLNKGDAMVVNGDLYVERYTNSEGVTYTNLNIENVELRVFEKN